MAKKRSSGPIREPIPFPEKIPMKKSHEEWLCALCIEGIKRMDGSQSAALAMDYENGELIVLEIRSNRSLFRYGTQNTDINGPGTIN
jgi:hypothetical protein